METGVQELKAPGMRDGSCDRTRMGRRMFPSPEGEPEMARRLHGGRGHGPGKDLSSLRERRAWE